MSSRHASPTLSFKIGRWLEAKATGWAVLLMPLILLTFAGLAVFITCVP